MARRRKLSKYFRDGPRKYQSYVHGAAARGIRLELSESEMIHLFHRACSYCGRLHHAVTGDEASSAPRPGDFNVCTSCGGVMRFQEDGGLAKVDAVEHLHAAL